MVKRYIKNHYFNVTVLIIILLTSGCGNPQGSQADKYSITIGNIVNGEIKTTKMEAAAGEIIRVWPKAQTDYSYVYGTCKYKNIATSEKSIIDDVLMYFEMPSYDIEITAEFKTTPNTVISEYKRHNMTGCAKISTKRQYWTTEGINHMFSFSGQGGYWAASKDDISYAIESGIDIPLDRDTLSCVISDSISYITFKGSLFNDSEKTGKEKAVFGDLSNADFVANPSVAETGDIINLFFLPKEDHVLDSDIIISFGNVEYEGIDRETREYVVKIPENVTSDYMIIKATFVPQSKYFN